MGSPTKSIKVPVLKPYSRVKIKPAIRHRSVKDYRRKPKHPNKPD